MTIKVTQTTNSFSVKIQQPIAYKVQTSGVESMAGNLADLEDFNPTGVQDKYLVMYDATTQKYITVDPDQVLSASITTGSGLPQEFVDQLDADLDSKIDLDAGTF